jgi:hypothetical protein
LDLRSLRFVRTSHQWPSNRDRSIVLDSPRFGKPISSRSSPARDSETIIRSADGKRIRPHISKSANNFQRFQQRWVVVLTSFCHGADPRGRWDCQIRNLVLTARCTMAGCTVMNQNAKRQRRSYCNDRTYAINRLHRNYLIVYSAYTSIMKSSYVATVKSQTATTCTH